MLANFKVAYKILYLSGYYDGIESKTGFSFANTIVDKIKPFTHPPTFFIPENSAFRQQCIRDGF